MQYFLSLYICAVQKIKLFISAGLIVLLFAMQLATLHQFSHDDSSTVCDICLVAQQVQSLDYMPVDAATVPTYIPIEVPQGIVNEYAFAKAELLSYYHLSRPPPVDC